MIKINNYISDIQKIITNSFLEFKSPIKFAITNQFYPSTATTTEPIVTICFDKISITPTALNNHLLNTTCEKPLFNTNINLNFVINVPHKLGANTCYDIFFIISEILIKNSTTLPFTSIFCNNLEFKKSTNCFLLTCSTCFAVTPI